MLESEAFKLLTLASARDGRAVTQAHAKVWADDLGRVDYFDAVEAMKLHYQESDKWIMPAHIIANVKRVRERLARESRRRLHPPAPNVITLDRDQYQRDVEAAIAKARAEKTGVPDG